MKQRVPNVYVVLLAALSVATLMVGCDEECVDGICERERGYYYDNLVSGVAYETRNEDGPTRTGVTGESDDPGSFAYLNDETISFSLGDTPLREAVAGERLTPFDVVAGVDEQAVGGCEVDGTLPEDDFRIVHNLAVLLQTMDTDGDPTTNIDISADVAALFDGVTIELDQSWETFQTDTGLLGVLESANGASLFPDTRTLRTREEALRALYEGIGLCTPAS